MKKLTPAMKDALGKVAREHIYFNGWYRAATAGERVSLAYLYYNGWCIRRAWRGEGTSSPAHEYQLAPNVEKAFQKKVAA